MHATSLKLLEELIEEGLHTARIPGAAIAIVSGSELMFAKGFGLRDLQARLPMTAQTLYPIASTTKSLTATLLSQLVDQRRLNWEVPVQHYLPDFRLVDPLVSSQVTLRDLMTMRTGLPRHDWVWFDHPLSRADLVRRLRYLQLSAGFREKFQYNNLSVTAAAHVAECVMEQSWERMIAERIFEPLSMSASVFALPEEDNVTRSYHENGQRELLPSRRFATEVTAPSGGAVHSNVLDMARWLAFNLGDGAPILEAGTLTQIHAPRTLVGAIDALELGARSAYATGWFSDSLHGSNRIFHGGYQHDIESELALFPMERLGIVAFTNFGFPSLSRWLSRCAFELLTGRSLSVGVREKLDGYERALEQNRQRTAAVRRIGGTSPSHPVREYAGSYRHPAYGEALIEFDGRELLLRRNSLVLSLEHWHYDAWVAADPGIFPLHVPHAFDRSNRITFDTDADGNVVALCIALEPAVAPIRFLKHS
jgi:CubicO group peptidase (beta-lactamase class C family)